MYLSEYCDVHYEENYNVVFVKWKKFCCKDDYRNPLEYALKLIKASSGCCTVFKVYHSEEVQ